MIDQILVYICGIGDLLFVITYSITMREWYKTWTGRFMMGWPISTGILFWLAIIGQWTKIPVWVARVSIALIAAFIVIRYVLLIRVDIMKVVKAKKEYRQEIAKIVEETKI